MKMSLSVEQAEALKATLRFTISRMSRIAGGGKVEPSKRVWAAERVEHLSAVLTMLDKGEESMADETYNGWTNRETWAANLHITNDEGLLSMATERLEGIDPQSFRAGEALAEWYEEITDEFGDSEGIKMMVRDVGSTWRVDWQEIAEGLLED